MKRFVRAVMISGAILVYCVTLFGGFYFVSSVNSHRTNGGTSDPGGTMSDGPGFT